MTEPIRFKSVAWESKKEKGLTKTHLMHKGKILCSPSTRIPADTMTVGRSDCGTCIRKGRTMQGRNFVTGKPVKHPIDHPKAPKESPWK